MNNNSFNDIIPPEDANKKSIRNIPIPEKKINKIEELLIETASMRAADHPPVTLKKETYSTLPEQPSHLQADIEENDKPRHVMWFIALVALLVLAGSIFFFFKKAEVKVTLKTESIPVNIIVTSTSDGVSASGTLVYKLMTIEKEAELPIKSSGEQVKTEKKASGTITIFNTFSAEPQKLIATTRFESKAGLIYRIDKDVVVPGMITGTRANAGPGSVEVTVYADQPGPSYNAGPQDFTIPGLKGSSKYDGFYARSKTPLAGGFSGVSSKVSESDLKNGEESLQKTLTATIENSFINEKPASYLFFKEGKKTTFTSVVNTNNKGETVLKGKMIAVGMIFEKDAVQNLLNERLSRTYRFDTLDTLSLSIIPTGTSTTPSFTSNQPLSLKLAGTLTSGESFDPSNLQKALSSKSKTQLQEILSMYPEIISAEATIHPIWSGNFPSNPDKIKIIIDKKAE